MIDRLRSFFAKEEQAPPSDWEDLVHTTLEYLSEASELSHQPSLALEAIRLHRSLYPNIGPENFFSFLQAVSSHYGLRLHLVKKRPSELREVMTPKNPFLIVLWEEGKPLPEVSAFTTHHSNSYQIKSLSRHNGTQFWKKNTEIAEYLSISGNDDFCYWIVAEPVLPFSMGEVAKAQLYGPTPIKTALERILHLIRLEKSDIWIIFIYGVGIGILSLVVPVATSSLVSIVAFGILLQPVLILTFLVVTFLGFAGLMQVIQTYVVEILQRRIFVRVATEFASRIPKIKLEALESFHRPELVNRFFDTMTIQKSINTLLVEGLAVVLTTIIGFILISFYHPLFLAFAIIILSVGAYLVAYKFGIKAGKSYLKISSEKYRVAAWLQEIARHNALFRSTFGSDFGLEKADSLTRDYLAAREKYFRYLVKQIIGFIAMQAIASALVLGLGGYLVISRQLTIGQLVAAELIIAKILGDLSKFNKQLESFYSLTAAMDKIGSVLALPSEPIREQPLEDTDLPIAVKLNEVHYELPNGDIPFSGINLEFPSGSKTAIHSLHPYQTQLLIDLIAGFRHPKLGNVEYDKQDIAEISEDELNTAVYVARGNEIFEGTVLENLRVGRDEISLIEIREVLEELGLWKPIQAMPKGIHTHVLTFGSPFDQVQSNTLLLARAILGKPRLLLVEGILDVFSDEQRTRTLNFLLGKDRPWTLILASRSKSILDRFPTVLSPLDMDLKKGIVPDRKRKIK